MSVRVVWILSFPIGSTNSTQNNGRVLFSRSFPTVECQARTIEGEKHVEVPIEEEMEDLLLTQLGLKSRASNFSPSLDSCSRYNQKPVFEINTRQGTLWPVVVIEQYGLLYCCLPLVEQGAYSRPPLISIPGISVGMTLLMGMADFVGKLPPTVDETHGRFMDLFLYISQAAPFGRPIDVNSDRVRHALSTKPSSVKPTQKLPAWKLYSGKVKSTIYLSVSEQIRAVQYDSGTVDNVWDVYGSVTCIADLEGVMPEVSINLTSVGPNAVPVSHLVVHPCTQSADADILKTDVETTGGKMPIKQRKLRFTPPSDGFILCHYAARVPDLPMKGFYQMKGEKKVEMLMELKLNEKIRNSFSGCFVQIPFFHRGSIIQFENSQSCGTVSISTADPRTLVWTIGQKFPKNYEAMLKATIHFNDYNPNISHGFLPEEPFCVGQNAYAQVFFKMTDFTHSGVRIDQKSVSVMPPSKIKITTASEYSTADFKIWNSHGNALTTYQPEHWDKSS